MLNQDIGSMNSTSSTKQPRRWTIPLALVFSLQSLVVGAAFIAVILVLVLQQQSQYSDAVIDRIGLHLQRSSLVISSPLTSREERFTQWMRRMKANPDMWFDDTMNQSSIPVQRFLDFSYFLVRDDPLAQHVFQLRSHSTLKHTNGDYIYGLMGISNTMLTINSKWDESKSVTAFYHPSYPLTYESPFAAPLSVSQEPWSYSRRKALTPSWGTGSVFYNPITKVYTVVASIGAPLIIDVNRSETTLSFTYTLNVSFMMEAVKEALVSPSSELILFDALNSRIFSTLNTNVADFNTLDNVMWNLTSFPNRQLINQFQQFASTRCNQANNCTVLVEDDGKDIKSIFHISTAYGMTLQVFQVTPRDVYFAAGEKSIMIGIIIGVVAAVVVLASCVVIWFAIRRPIHQLRESMEFAAVMRNDEVSDTSSVLTELNLLSVSFMQMNDKLLQARAFMPQALLFNGDTAESEVACSEDDMDDDYSSFANKSTKDGNSPTSSVQIAVQFPDDGEVSPSSSAQPTSHLSLPQPSNTATRLIVANDGRSVRTLSGMSGSQHSSSRNTRKSTDASSISHSHIISTLATHSGGLLIRKVAILMVNARGTHKLAAYAGSMRLEREQVRLVELVERCARADKGIVDIFQGDHFTISFNASRPVASPSRNGVLAGLSIQEGGTKDGLGLGTFSIALAVGKAHTGNVGTSTMKKNCIVGPAYSQAFSLERLSKRIHRPFLVSGRCLSEIEAVVFHQLIGRTVFIDSSPLHHHHHLLPDLPRNHTTTDTILSPFRKDSPTNTKSVIGGGNNGAAEWLYEMEATSMSNPFYEVNQAVELCLEGKYMEARSAIDAALEKIASSDDVDADSVAGGYSLRAELVRLGKLLPNTTTTTTTTASTSGDVVLGPLTWECI